MNKLRGWKKSIFIFSGCVLALQIFGSDFAKITSVSAADVPNNQTIGLEEMQHFESLPYFKDGVQNHQVSSRDPTGGNDDLEHCLYYIDPPDNTQCVMIDAQGPGIIDRLELTGSWGGESGIFDFYFDGEATPSLSMSFIDMFSGLNAPFLFPLVGNDTTSSGSYFSYVPMPFASSVKIVHTHSSSPPEHNYFVVGYRTFSSGAGITTFDPNTFSIPAGLWENMTVDPKSTSGNITIPDSVDTIAGGTTVTLAEISGSAGSVNSIKFKFSENDRATLQNLYLTMTWDGENTPSVNRVPFGQFFGNGLGVLEEGLDSYNDPVYEPVNAIPLGLDNAGWYYCYFPMPYLRSAKIEIENANTGSITSFDYQIQYNTANTYQNLGNQAGYFRAKYNSQTPTVAGEDYTILNLDNAKGQVVGISLTTDGIVYDKGDDARRQLEGDERIYIDGSKTPQMYGTGTEDFFGGSWYFQNGAFTQPVHGNPAHIEGNAGRVDSTAAYRFFLSDAIRFNDSIKFGIEHGGTNDVLAGYSSVAYYYGVSYSGLTKTMDLNVGTETTYYYENSGATETGDSNYAFEGDDDQTATTDSGYSYTGDGDYYGTNYSQFTIPLVSGETGYGVKLRRQFDYGVVNQKAKVYNTATDEELGTWYDSGSNNATRWAVPSNQLSWRESEFEISADALEGYDNEITIKIVPEASAVPNWTEYHYEAYAYRTDINPPYTTATFNPASPDGSNGWYKAAAPTITLSSDDDESEATPTTRYRWDSGAWQDYSAAIAPAEGSHTLYYYSTDSADNNEETRSQSVKYDAAEPQGSIIIAGNIGFTTTFTNTLTIASEDNLATSGELQMQVSNNPTFTGASWEAYATSKSWVLDREGSATKVVYVRFRDLADNVSATYYDTINLISLTEPVAETSLPASASPTAVLAVSKTGANVNLSHVDPPVLSTINNSKINGAGRFSGVIYENAPIAFSGTAIPNVTVRLYVHSVPIDIELSSDENGNWSHTLAQGLPAGNHYVEAEAVDSNGNKSDRVVVARFVVIANATATPTSSSSSSQSQPLLPYIIIGIGAAAVLYFLLKGSQRRPLGY